MPDTTIDTALRRIDPSARERCSRRSVPASTRAARSVTRLITRVCQGPDDQRHQDHERGIGSPSLTGPARYTRTSCAAPALWVRSQATPAALFRGRGRSFRSAWQNPQDSLRRRRCPRGYCAARARTLESTHPESSKRLMPRSARYTGPHGQPGIPGPTVSPVYRAPRSARSSGPRTRACPRPPRRGAPRARRGRRRPPPAAGSAATPSGVLQRRAHLARVHRVDAVVVVGTR